MEGLRVMGIDPGLTRCGLSVVQAGRGRAVIPVSVAVVRTSPSDVLDARLLKLSEAVGEFMDDYHPDVIAIERIFERGNVSTVMHTAHAVGVIVLAAATRGIATTMYTPSEVKKAISGNGRADKKQMTTMITRILGLSEPPKPADAADALALAVCHCWRAPLAARQELSFQADQASRSARGRLGKAKADFNQRTRAPRGSTPAHIVPGSRTSR